jgi:predicted ferric reductase
VWLVVGPAGGGWVSFLGQLAGAESVLLMAVAIVLISVLPVVETWFDGIDRTAIWHRRLSITGMLLLVPHVLFAAADHPDGRGGTAWGGLLANVGVWGLAALVVWAVLPRWRDLLPLPRSWVAAAAGAVRELPAARWCLVAGRWVLGGYERWRSLHRLTGLFLAAGFVHGLLDGTMFGSPLLRWTYLGVGGTGLAFYLYRETVARFFLPLHDYQVATVTPVAGDITELALTPVGRPLHFVPGQFAMLYLETGDGWRRHPFTMSGAPDRGVDGGPGAGTLRFTIKGLGDGTRAIQSVVQPGMPAVIGGPHGRFDHTRGTDRQVWVAGGIGVTPFLSWLRSAPEHRLPTHVDFFYSNDGPAPFATEVTAIAAGEPGLRVHIHDSIAAGFLSADRVLDAVSDTDAARVSFFLCGPAPMLDAFIRAFRRAGVPARNIHREHFAWR